MSSKRLKVSIVISGFALALAAIPAIKQTVEKQLKFKYGDYVASEDAYFATEIPDSIKGIYAEKYVTPTDSYYNTQKNYSHGTNMIGDIESVWGSYTGKGTKIAIIDDGFDYTHPEYTRKDGTSAILSASRYYYTSGNYVYYSEYSSNPSCIGEDWDSDYNEWATHGTNTSTTAAAPMNNGGGVGIAPEADILALKIDMSFGAIDQAIRYAVAQGVDVINMSLGAYADYNFVDGWGDTHNNNPDYDASDYAEIADYLEEACQQAYNAGIIVVAAAGNESTWHKSYPACNYKVVGVGALEENDVDTLAAFTNYVLTSQTGEINVDILAPGYVYTAHQLGTQSSPTHGYNNTQGTSFSSPLVAGAACLWKQKNPTGTPDQFLAKLQSSASDIGSYANKMVPVSLWGDYSDVGPSAIQAGRLNVAELLDIDEPYISIKQSSVNIVEGGKKQIDLDTYNGTVTYSIANTSIATVSATGLVTGVTAGSTSLTVTATKNGHTASTTIPVTVAAKVACQSISLSTTEITLSAGETYNIEPTITTVPANATREFMFESTDESVATVDFESGLLTAVAAGETTINILAAEGDGEATLSVEVSEASVITWEKVSSTSGLVSGKEYIFGYSTTHVSGQLSGSYLPALEGATFSNGVIISLPSGYESFILGTSNSKYTLKQTSNNKYLGYNAKNLINSDSPVEWTISISSGDVSISVGSYILAYNAGANPQRWKTYDSNFSGEDYSLYVKKASAPAKITGISLDQSTLNLATGSDGNLTATVSGTGDYDKTVTWTSSNTSVATVSKGSVHAVAAGTAVITATAGTFSAQCTVTVTDVSVGGVTLTQHEVQIVVNNTSTLSATIAPSNATNKSVSWTSSNTSVATVDANGVVTAKAVGNANITVTTADGGFTDTCAVTVITIPATGVTLNKNSETVAVGSYFTLTATVTPNNAVNKSVNWSSDNTSVATVNSSGKVTGVAVGTANITVTTVDGGYTATCVVTVSAQKSSLQIAYEAAAALSAGQTTSQAYTFTGVITSSSSDSFYMQDGDYAMYVYRAGSSNNFSLSQVGRKATVKATLKNYSGTLETGSITSISYENTDDVIEPKDVTSYDYLSNLNQSVLSNLTSGVVTAKTSAISYKSTDMKFTVSIGGTPITIFGSKYLDAYQTLNSYYNSFNVGDYISIANCVSSCNNGNIQLSITEQTLITVGYSLEAYCKEFLNNITCNPNGTSAPTFATGYSWSDFKTLFGKLSTTDQNTLKNANINEAGSLTEQVAAKYNYIVAKYHYENFINRTIVNNLVTPFMDYSRTSGSTIILIFIVASLIGVGSSIMVIHKKKHK